MPDALSRKTLPVTCQKMVYDEGRICDKPASHVYYGIGGATRMCREHTEGHLKRWGKVSVRSL